MSLHPARVRSYLCVALAGPFAALVVAHRDAGTRRWLPFGPALFCGALSVACEERAQHS